METDLSGREPRQHLIHVDLRPRGYDVLVGRDLLPEAGRRILETGLAGTCAVVTDSTVGALYAGTVCDSLRAAGSEPLVVTVPSGETSKSLTQAEAVCDRMIGSGLDRGAFVVALGGGVVGDLAGFVAAIYYRGIPFVQIPTTIIAQVDSAVGGKTGVNATGGKNLIGAFHQPHLVLADVDTLDSLPPRERNQGFAEIIKHGVIRDRTMLDDLGEQDLPSLIARNVAIKAAIVADDERETTGERALLNFGHTVGHAIENAAGYGRYFHGEAISLGLCAACDLSVRKAGLPVEDRDLVVRLLEEHQLPTRLPPEIATDAVMDALRTDKKFASGEVRFVLSPRLGSAYVSRDVTLDEIRGAVEALR